MCKLDKTGQCVIRLPSRGAIKTASAVLADYFLEAYMAQRVNIVLEDDIDHSVADETVTFALDGKSFEIDLSSANADRLRAALEEFRAVARPLGGRVAVKPARKRSASGNATDIRAWAVAQGLAVSARGRVPAEIRAAYEAAH